MSKTCLKCTCSAGVAPNPNVYQCEELGSVNNPYEWNDFVCEDPAVICVDPISNEQHYPGDSWFADKELTTNKCDEFCYCTAEGVTVCETGFAAIISSNNTALVDLFYDKCGDAIEACGDDATRMFSRYTGSSCGEWTCPRCDCDSHSVGDMWYTEKVDKSDANTAKCLSCECVESYTGNYTECESLDRYAVESGACPAPNAILCHESIGYDACTGSNCVEKAIANHTISTKSCSTNAPSAWCGWGYHSGESRVFTFGATDIYHWGCGDDDLIHEELPLCPVYGANNQCFYGQYNASYTDCDGLRQTESGRQYQYCCNDADYCNFVDVDISSCTESTEFSMVLQAWWTCATLHAPVFTPDDCEPLVEQATTCETIRELFETTGDCFCNLYEMLYNDAPAEWKDQISFISDHWMEDIAEWDALLGCNLDLSCNITATLAPATTEDITTTASESTLLCHSGDGECSGSECAEKAIANHTLNTIDCTSTNNPYSWCGWSIDIDANDVSYDLGCGHSVFCSVYGVNGQCFYSHNNASYTDCDGVTQTLPNTEYRYCCNDADHCNFGDIDTSTCAESTRWNTLMHTFDACVASYSNVHMEYCGIPSSEEDTCDTVREYFAAEHDCWCPLYTAFYNDTPAERKPVIGDRLQRSIDNKIEDIAARDAALGCNINMDLYTCDITATLAPATTEDITTTAPQSTLLCHSGDGECSGSECAEKAIANHTLNPIDCTDSAPFSWCEWSIDIDANDVSYDLGCGDTLFCSVYGVNGQCFYSHDKINYTNYCDDGGLTQTKSSTEYRYCCNDADHCNFGDIDTSTCTESTRWDTLLHTFHACVASYSNVHMDYCGIASLEEDTCDTVRESFVAVHDCWCPLYAAFYNDASAERKPLIGDQIQRSLSLDNMIGDIAARDASLGCNMDLYTCDITATSAPIATEDSTTTAPEVIVTQIISLDSNEDHDSGDVKIGPFVFNPNDLSSFWILWLAIAVVILLCICCCCYRYVYNNPTNKYDHDEYQVQRTPTGTTPTGTAVYSV